MKLIISHIPHSSTILPDKEGYLVDESILDSELLKLTDWYTDELFQENKAINIKAEFSRIFCDVERFPDDKDEIMSKFGMGMIYEKTDDGKPLRNVTPQIRKNIYADFYRTHHQKLTEAVESQLKQFNQALILDCHSFPDIPLKRDLNQDSLRPDFNIGTCNFHTPQKLIDLSVQFFKEKEYSVSIDSPYSGTIVPIVYYLKDNRVHSIMLEINRKLYLEGNTNIKSGKFEEIKALVSDYIGMLKNA